MQDLSVLNKQQREAVECLEGPLLVLAGAGSGKTRVLTYRIANLIEHGVAPWNILALTFTNKAAREMRERTEALIDAQANDMWVMTFHSCCSRILRMDAEHIGYERNFLIYDDGDQMNLITDILKQMGKNEKNIPKRDIKEAISDAKNKAEDPAVYLAQNYADDLTIEVYRKYEKRLKEANAFDFDDLMLKVLELFKKCPDVLEKYRRKFKYVLVDEYQDTNALQYSLIALLCKEHGNICVVGDDDQSIYGWRGADIRNILDFEKDFKGAKVIRLEQNYRSTSCILDAANAVISHNIGRKSKSLWTNKKGGDKITYDVVPTERDEAGLVCRRILENVRNGKKYSDHAILYRMNAQSRVLESMLINYGIPHKVYGGMRFFERKEIKDILAYLRLIYNPNDDVSFLRIVNIPKRGIGDSTLHNLSLLSQSSGQSLFVTALSGEGLDNKTISKLRTFTDKMAELMALCATMPLSSFTEEMIVSLNYEEYLRSEDKKGETDGRMDNLRELVGNISEIERDVDEESGVTALQSFLENVALVSDIDGMNDENDTVSLMTLHSAKGLEFNTVYLVGMEENIFPTSRASNLLSADGMEEERRLCYVGITRAREKLHLISAESRMLFGSYSNNRRSRFIDEIPSELLDMENMNQLRQQRENVKSTFATQNKAASPHVLSRSTSVAPAGIKKSAPMQTAAPVAKEFAVNDKVCHAQFGEGTVMSVSGSGNTMVVNIHFLDGKIKNFAAAYAPLEKMG
ncbi:MAG: UvrD-helicase domain-containing protein [Clostridia bacterium]|nr:UvrD-helicase domain-containing protein [Clostridia bacterium]